MLKRNSRPMRRITCFLSLLLALLGARAEPAPAYALPPELRAAWLQSAPLVLERLNRERVRLGLAELGRHEQLDRAAQAHADHLARHRRATHAQQREEAGFLGSMPWDRARAHGYGLGQVGVVAEAFVVGIADVDTALMQLLSGPYHRHILLSARAVEVGIGLSAQPGLVMEFGAARAAPQAAPDWLLWPSPGQEDVPALACCERPRPAGLDRFGMPVSVHVPPGRVLKVQRFELFEEPSGRAVEALLLHAESDPLLKLHRNLAYLVPRLPLLPGGRYRAEFEGEAGGLKLARSWQFDTAAERPLP